MASSESTSKVAAPSGYWKFKFDAMEACYQQSGSFWMRKWVLQSLILIYHYSVTNGLLSTPPSQVTIGRGYKWLIDMFNGTHSLIEANDHKEELLENGADINNKDIFDCK